MQAATDNRGGLWITRGPGRDPARRLWKTRPGGDDDAPALFSGRATSAS